MRKILNSSLNESETFERCVDVLSVSGAVLLLPTDTVYGLVCRWNDSEAISAIRRMKERGARKPFQMLAPNIDAVEKAGVAVSGVARSLSDAFCPGPLTIIARAGDKTGTIGFRIPNDSFLSRLMIECGSNLAATSANPAGKTPIVSVSDAGTLFTPPPALIVDGGRLSGVASTVVDATSDAVSLIRTGALSDEMILDVANGDV
ncbi:MAG: L-threonylcarbamoyladenylate synthase [Kiritimatiellaeota bacterium]|nr:L-threonylcarbamoyladenylate synthase [Kiritimatiellota bacterium]